MSNYRPQVRARVRAKVSGTAARPRLHVHVSNSHVRAELVDDVAGKTITAVSTEAKKEVSGKNMTEKAQWVADQIAASAQKNKIKSVVFDRGSRTYHGRVKAFAESARAAGLEF